MLVSTENTNYREPLFAALFSFKPAFINTDTKDEIDNARLSYSQTAYLQ